RESPSVPSLLCQVTTAKHPRSPRDVDRQHPPEPQEDRRPRVSNGFSFVFQQSCELTARLYRTLRVSAPNHTNQIARSVIRPDIRFISVYPGINGLAYKIRGRDALLPRNPRDPFSGFLVQPERDRRVH